MTVALHADAWQADIQMLDPLARTLRMRTVQGRTPSCSSIDVATAVVIATMLDSIHVAQVSPAPAADGDKPELGVFAAVGPGVIPRAWLGAGLALELGAPLPLTFSASAYAPAEHTDALGRGTSLWGWHAGLALCPAAVRSNSIDLHICAGAEAGVVFASGINLTRATDTTLPLLLLHAGPKLTIEVTRVFAVQLAAAAAFIGVRPKIRWNIEGEPEHVLSSQQIGLLMQFGITISPW